MIRARLIAGLGPLLSLLIVQPSWSAPPTVRQALSLVPMQKDVSYDEPGKDQIDGCKIRSERQGENRAWVVTDPNGNLLRRFSDTNGDNKIDQWCYFEGGVEVYRDIDGDFNEKADQYRWFGTGGLRWGLDRDEDGKIDAWKWISPEEVTAELVSALSAKDVDRFAALLITDEELQRVGLSDDLARQIARRTAKSREDFTKFAAQQDVDQDTNWVDFSAPQPGVVPGDSAQSTRDVIVYENVIAMTESDGQHGQIQVGTLVKIDERWRLIGLPSAEDAGFFYRSNRTAMTAAGGSQPLDGNMQNLVQQLEALDKQHGQSSDPAAIQRVYQQRIGLLQELASASEGDDRDMWLLQLIDSAIATSQPSQGTSNIGLLEKIVDDISAATKNKAVIAQAQFAYLTADYSASLQNPKANLAKIQTHWIEKLESFVKEYPGTRPAAEAMLQLAISDEFAGEDKSAETWYAKIVKDNADTVMAGKARGAIRRLNSVGKPLELRGKGLTGTPIDIAELRGHVIVVHYWATWCEPCKQDMEELKQLLAQYGRFKFSVVGVNLDDDPKAAIAYLQQQRLSWPQLHEAGGLESGLAKQWGIFTLPVMMLIDPQGRIANRSTTVAELESELKKRLRAKR